MSSRHEFRNFPSFFWASNNSPATSVTASLVQGSHTAHRLVLFYGCTVTVFYCYKSNQQMGSKLKKWRMGIVAKKSTPASQVFSFEPIIRDSYVWLSFASPPHCRVAYSALQRFAARAYNRDRVLQCDEVCCSMPLLYSVLQWPAQAKCCSVRCNVRCSVRCSVHCVCVAVCVAVCIAVCVAVCVAMWIFETDPTMYWAYLSKPAYLVVCVGARIAAMCVLIGPD